MITPCLRYFIRSYVKTTKSAIKLLFEENFTQTKILIIEASLLLAKQIRLKKFRIHCGKRQYKEL